MAKLDSLTKEKLSMLYTYKKKSLEDIAEVHGVSKTAIFKKLKKFNIQQRSKSQARLEAQKQGKVPQKYYDINESFFSKWSIGMSYILGLLLTDGCMSKAKRCSYSIRLCLNDRDLLEKVAKAMGSSHAITVSKEQKGLNMLVFSREKISQDLIRLGMKPRKSLDLNFPAVPKRYLPDFIRGVFDGDGSVYFEPKSPRFPVRTKFNSGSKDFIRGLEKGLQDLGMPKRVIYERKTKNGISYMFRYGHKDSKKLFSILYENTGNSVFLKRKYRKFLEGFQKEEGI